MSAFYLFEKGENVVFVSKDLTMRVKAEAMGLDAEDYENLKFSYDKIYRGYRNVQVSKEQIDYFYKDGSIDLEITDLFPNEYCLMTAGEQSSAIGKYDSKSKKIIALLRSPEKMWGSVP